MALTEFPCDVLGCEAGTRVGRELTFEGSRRIWFMVCASHVARLDQGEVPLLVDRPFNLNDSSTRPALMMESV